MRARAPQLHLYLDPRHNRCLRAVLLTPTSIYMGGSDGDDTSMRSWMVKGRAVHDHEQEKQYRIDFSTKPWHEGAQILTATLNSDGNLLWSDGNAWLRVSTRLNRRSHDLGALFLHLVKTL